jgi:hypothetical protein
MKTAYATIKGFEVMRMFKKGQFTPWIEATAGGTEAHFINRLFGIMLSHRRDPAFARPDRIFATVPRRSWHRALRLRGLVILFSATRCCRRASPWRFLSTSRLCDWPN